MSKQLTLPQYKAMPRLMSMEQMVEQLRNTGCVSSAEARLSCEISLDKMPKHSQRMKPDRAPLLVDFESVQPDSPLDFPFDWHDDRPNLWRLTAVLTNSLDFVKNGPYGPEHTFLACMLPSCALILFNVDKEVRGNKKDGPPGTASDGLKWRDLKIAYNEQLYTLMAYMRQFPCFGSLHLKPPQFTVVEQSKDVASMAYADLLSMILQWTPTEFNARMGAAALDVAANKKEADPQNRILHSMRVILKDAFTVYSQSNKHIYYPGTPKYVYKKWMDGISSYAQNLVGRYYDEITDGIRTCVLKDLFTPNHEHSTLWMKRVMCFVGLAGKGKGILAHAIAYLLTVAQGKECYYMTNALDPVGLQCRANAMENFGCVILDDIKMESCKDTKLELEECKNAFEVESGGSYKSRYHVAEFPAGQPRILLENNMLDPHSEVLVSWFAQNKMTVADIVYRNPPDASQQIKKITDDVQKAIARRLVIFPIEGFCMTKTYWKELTARKVAKAAEMLQQADAAPPTATDVEFGKHETLEEK
jgi:hypothetical protein